MGRITASWIIVALALALAGAACQARPPAPPGVARLPLSACERPGDPLAARDPLARLSDPICARLDPGALDARTPAAHVAPVRLPLPRGPDVAAWRTGGGGLGGAEQAWIGQTAAGGRVVLVAWHGEVAGTIHTGDAIYRVIAHGAGRVEIARRSPALPPAHPPGSRARGAAGSPPPGDARPRGPTTIDLIVEYTGKARATCPMVEAELHVAIAEANVASRDSAVDVRFELVDVLEAPRFRETGRMDDDLALFERQGDTALEEIHPRRARAGADIAVLVVDEDGSYLGDASTIMASAATAFAVVDCRFLTGVPVFAHELGHLMGLRHDSDPEARPFADGHGYRSRASRDDRGWATVMAADCDGCARILRWSNPRVRYPGTSAADPFTGVAGTSDSARVLGTTARGVSRFRARPRPRRGWPWVLE